MKWERTVKTILVTLLLGAMEEVIPPFAHAQPDALVFAQRGVAPILLTAPHAGSEDVPRVTQVRACGTTSPDAWTKDVTEMVVSRLQELLGKRPYVVMARFHRKWIDANRSEDTVCDPGDEDGVSYTDPDAGAHYRAYHGSIRTYVNEIRQKWPGGGVLVDIHGHSRTGEHHVVHRGTRDGATVTRLTKVSGIEALTGRGSIFGRLQAAGYTVYPPNTPPGSPRESLNGGYTVAAYGSHRADGIDAIQVEIGRDLREDQSRRRKFAEDLAGAIVAFSREYLGVTPAEDCLSYDPKNLRVANAGPQGYRVVDGNRWLFLLDKREDAERVLVVAKRHTKTCFIGRGNGRSDGRHIVHYFKGDSGIRTKVAGQDCLSYDTQALRVREEGKDWLLTDGRSRMLMLDDRAQAEAALQLARQHRAHCFVGRDNKRQNRATYVVEYWQ
jgi:N-formylglutamate amidohydrolase